MAARESAVEKMWDVGIVEPANSLIGYNLFFGQNEESDGVEAFWQAQGNTTETHSEIVSNLFWRLLSSCMLKCIICNSVNRCAHAQDAQTDAQHELLDDASTEAEVRREMTATWTCSACQNTWVSSSSSALIVRVNGLSASAVASITISSNILLVPSFMHQHTASCPSSSTLVLVN